MSEVLAQLEKKGGGFTEKQLWSNPSPTSNFSAQNITLSQSYLDFKYVKVKWLKNTGASQTDLCEAIISSDDLSKVAEAGSANKYMFTIGATAPTYATFVRSIKVTSNTKLAFSVAFNVNTSGNDNSIVIPIAVYGLN